ncbi:MAG TPA: methyltransferase domain-containing protein [Polyangiales bacterium]|nr:methyltransferase domain-containing protein [Polyangiales bacterium]
MDTHRARIVDQFTRQAVPFSTAPGIRDQTALQLLVDCSGVTKQESVLDVACGPGLVLRAFAPWSAQVTGIDVTPAMLVRARELVAGLPNVTLDAGDVAALPYPDHSFDVVVSRFAFHHLPNPQAVLGEMKRVCRPGGRVIVCDLLASEDPNKAAAFHELELIRDPSHYRARRLDELQSYYRAHDLTPELAAMYQLTFELESYLARSFPTDGNIDALRERYLAAVSDDAIGLHLTRVGDQIHGAYDVAILRATCS